MSRYDTAAIRNLARRLENTASGLSNTERSYCGNIDRVNGELKGDTAQAIDYANDRLSQELRSIRSGLSGCASALYRYARELDIADEKLSEFIKSR